MVEWIVAKAGTTAVSYAAGSAAALSVAFILKKIPNDVMKAKFGQVMYGLGITCTLGLAKWKYTSAVWNKTVEPWVIDAIDNIIVNGIAEFIRGLRSDNVS